MTIGREHQDDRQVKLSFLAINNKHFVFLKLISRPFCDNEDIVFILNPTSWLTIPLSVAPEALARQAVSGTIKENAHE